MGKDPLSGLHYCMGCDYSSGNPTHVKEHIEAKHIENMSIVCDICGTVTKTRKAMRMHKLRRHRNDASSSFI